MAYELTAVQARTMTSSDMVIYNEVDAINKAIFAATGLGELQATVDDNTTITTSTPLVIVTGTVANPTVGVSAVTLTVAGNSITLPPNSTVYQIVGVINEAAIPGLTARKNAQAQVELTYNPSQTQWLLTIGDNTANAVIGLTAGTTNAPEPLSVQYHSTWSGALEDRKKSYEIAQVTNYFQNLGYSILTKKNTQTGNTLKWEIYW